MPKQIVIVGGGFSGLKVAQTLEKAPGIGRDFEVTLINRDNFLLFTPFLTEALGGMLDEKDVISPLRAFLRMANFVMGDVTDIDVHTRTVSYRRPLTEDVQTLKADHLVIALGSTTSFHHAEHIEPLAFTLKSLDDATVLRNHLIALLEQANLETDMATKKAYLTVVAVGAGYTGVEGAGVIRDLLKEAVRDYPNIEEDEIRVVLVDLVEHILPMIDPSLADYATHKLEQRGVEMRLGQTITEADADSVTLSKGEKIGTHTILWSAGVVPSPLTAKVDAKKDKKGAIMTDPTMAVPDLHNVWAMGDCAHIPNLLEEGRPYTGTAQNAEREAKQLAKNILAVMEGREPEPFLFRTLGEFVNLGHQEAVAQIKFFKFSGVLAWLMWRVTYLVKIPHWSRKARVLSGWTLDMIFGRTALETESPRLVRTQADDRRAAGEIELSKPKK